MTDLLSEIELIEKTEFLGFIKKYKLNSKESLKIMNDCIKESTSVGFSGEDLLLYAGANYIERYSKHLTQNLKCFIGSDDELFHFFRVNIAKKLLNHCEMIRDFMISEFKLKSVAHKA